MESQWGAAALGALITGIITTLVWGVLKIMNARHTMDRRNRVDALSQMEAVNDRLRQDYNELKTEYKDLREEMDKIMRSHTVCREELASLKSMTEERIGYLEDALDKAGLKFHKSVGSGETGNHPPLKGGDNG